MRYNYFLAYVTAFSGTGRQEEEEDGKTLVWGKWDRAINWLFCRDCQLKLRFSGLLQKDLLKGNWSWAKSCFKQNYCHACHTRFAVFFPLPSCCVSSLIIVNLRNRTAGRRRRQNARVWRTWQGCFLRVLSWSSLNTNVFWSFTKTSV